MGEAPAFFHRGPSALARFAFFGLLSVAAMIADHRFGMLEPVRVALSAAMLPVQTAALAPVTVAEVVGDRFTDQASLLRENEDMRARLLAYATAAQEAELLRAENARLLGLTGQSAAGEDPGLVARIVSTGRNPFARKVLLDKGVADGVQPGMPVVDVDGVVGQVTAVGALGAEATLLTEKGQLVPVMMVRNGLRAVVEGAGGAGRVALPHIPASADIREGDLFVTSGIDGVYPAGLAVARVTAVERNVDGMFARVTALPAGGVGNHRYVRILRAVPTPVIPPPQAGARREPARPGRAPERPRSP